MRKSLLAILAFGFIAQAQQRSPEFLLNEFMEKVALSQIALSGKSWDQAWVELRNSKGPEKHRQLVGEIFKAFSEFSPTPQRITSSLLNDIGKQEPMIFSVRDTARLWTIESLMRRESLKSNNNGLSVFLAAKACHFRTTRCEQLIQHAISRQVDQGSPIAKELRGYLLSALNREYPRGIPKEVKEHYKLP